MKTGIELITDERKRQIEELGYDVKHDDLYSHNELSEAAICYAEHPSDRAVNSEQVHVRWPWQSKYWKPMPEDRIRELTKAGALIAAQIDRLQLEKNW